MEAKKPRKITPEEVVEIRERFSGQMDEMVQNLNRRALEAAEREKNPRVAILEAQSAVPLAKRSAYLRTQYRLGFGPDSIVLEINSHSGRLAAQFAEYGVTCGAFITAYNPEGTQQSDEANSRDHAALLAQVAALGHAFIEGEGADAGEGDEELAVGDGNGAAAHADALPFDPASGPLAAPELTWGSAYFLPQAPGAAAGSAATEGYDTRTLAP